MPNGQNDGRVLPRPRYGFQALQPIFVLGFPRVDPGVEYINLSVIALQGAHNVHHLSVAHVGAVLFEGQAQHQYLAAEHRNAFAQHELDGGVGHMGGHVVVDAAACQDDVRVITDLLRLVREVIRIHPNAMSAYQARAERQEVPLGAGCL